MSAAKSSRSGPPSLRIPADFSAAWPGVVEEWLAVGDRSVRVLRAPSRSRSGGEPQLLLHGLGASAVTWLEVMPGLRDDGPVVAVDLPGFGHTSAGVNDPLTIEGYVAFVIELADTLGWTRFAVHGNSMGGLIATLLAADFPERVARAVLVSPALPPATPVHLLVPSPTTLRTMLPIAVSTATAAALGIIGAGAALDERRNRELLGLIFADPAGVRPELLEVMAAEYADDGTAASRRRALIRLLLSIAALWADPRRVNRAIAAIECPTLMIGGTADALVPASVLRRVLARRPDWEGHVLDDRRHALMMESPADYLRLVQQWSPGARNTA